MSCAEEQITLLLKELSGGRKEAGDRLVPLVYSELRKMAAGYMRRERTGHTLQPTALVHEAYFRLVNHAKVDWQSRSHFFAVAAQVMRRILVDYSRETAAAKRGGGPNLRVTLDEKLAFTEGHSTTSILAIDEALCRLAMFEPRQCKVVELRYFVGLSIEETAEVLSISSRTVRREWRLAKAWLYAELAQPSMSVAHT